jgi:hypothetical protein
LISAAAVFLFGVRGEELRLRGRDRDEIRESIQLRSII